jgi:hypothetical protein
VATSVMYALSSCGILTESCTWLAPYYPDHAAFICTHE